MFLTTRVIAQARPAPQAAGLPFGEKMGLAVGRFRSAFVIGGADGGVLSGR